MKDGETTCKGLLQKISSTGRGGELRKGQEEAGDSEETEHETNNRESDAGFPQDDEQKSQKREKDKLVEYTITTGSEKTGDWNSDILRFTAPRKALNAPQAW